MEKVVQKENIIIAWIRWHYYVMPKFLLQVWKNYIMFATNYFSLPMLLSTLFSPWRRNAWAFPKTIDVGEYFNIFISNIFSRIIGFILRIVLVIVGAVFQILVVLFGLATIIFWLLIPFIIIYPCLTSI